MSLAEGVSATIVYKAYASGAITAISEDLAPSASGAQTLRRVSTSLNLQRASYASAEIRGDRQIADMRLGVKSVTGDITGELSPATYFDFFEAVHRGTKVAAITLTEADLTSVAASGANLTFASGDPVALGLSVGDIIRFTGMSTAANNDNNFLITGISGTGNRVLAVLPEPTSQSADTVFSLSRPGATTMPPSSSFTSRKFGIEIRHEDLDISRLLTEVRVASYSLSMPATGMATVTVGFMGRDEVLETGAGSPYFTSPTAATTTTIVAAVNGRLVSDGVQIAVVTGATVNFSAAPEAANVVGQDFAAEFFLGRATVTGTLSLYLQDTSFLSGFNIETEYAIILQMDCTTAANTDSIVIYMPRVKLTSADVAVSGEGGQMVSCNFQALKYVGAGVGIPVTTIRIHDTAAS